MLTQPFRCLRGRLQGNLPRLDQAFKGRFQYDLSQARDKTLTLFPFHFSAGQWRLDFRQRGQKWQVDAKTNGQLLQNHWLVPLLPDSFQWLQAISGKLAIRLNASGTHETTQLRLRTDGLNLLFHDSQYRRAGERLQLQLNLTARRHGHDWQGSLKSGVDGGEVLFLPIYLSFDDHPLRLQGDFHWQPHEHSLKIEDLRIDLTKLGSMFINSKIGNGINSELLAGLQLDLPTAFRLFAHPFLEGGDWEGLDIKSGEAKGRLTSTGPLPEQARIRLLDVTVSDSGQRIGVNRLQARLNWQRTLEKHPRMFPTSRIGWHAAHVYAIPVGKTEFFLRLIDDDIRLLKPTSLPVLDGAIRLDRLELLDLSATPKVHLAGKIEAVSLELLTRVLGIPPLAGTVSGRIPGVLYNHREHTLKLDGQLVLDVFDGTVIIENLLVTHLFGALPRLQVDVSFHDLDLELVTRHFSFGRITGKLEGHIHKLQLEKWQPVAFDAWFGTPPDDGSRHRISQQAVSNLTDLGGGGVSGLLSRTFLRFFDEFGYRRIGLGLRLANNVCTLRGVAPASQGYYIVTGAGLPRIDVIGYNRRIDWPTLLKRLSRITQLQTPVVE